MAVYQKISTIYPTTGLGINAAGGDDEGVADMPYFIVSLWDMAGEKADKEAQGHRRREDNKEQRRRRYEQDNDEGWYDDRTPEEKESARILQACAWEDAWVAEEEARADAVRWALLQAEYEWYEAYGDPEDDPPQEEERVLRLLGERNSRSQRVGKKHHVTKSRSQPRRAAAEEKRRVHASAAKRAAKERRAEQNNVHEAAAEQAEKAECECWACSDEWAYNWHTLGMKHLGYEWCWCDACSAWPRCTYKDTQSADDAGESIVDINASYAQEERDAIETDREFFEDD